MTEALEDEVAQVLEEDDVVTSDEVRPVPTPGPSVRQAAATPPETACPAGHGVSERPCGRAGAPSP